MAYDPEVELAIYDKLPSSIRLELANLTTNVPPSKIVADTETEMINKIHQLDAKIRLMIPAFSSAAYEDCSGE